MVWDLSVAFVLLVRCFITSLAIPNATFTDESALLAFKSHLTSDPHNILGSNWTTSTSFCTWFGVTCNAPYQPRVTALNLPNMQLQGTISPSIANLSYLASFNLRNNSFHGQLPNELAHLQNLRILNLEYNNFNGNIPSSISMLFKLQHLLLSNNSLAGTIPPSLFHITTLERLSLQSNSLQGNIPENIGNLSKLKILHMGDNLFSGAIPLKIFNLSSLKLIDLQSNFLSGTIKVDICNHISSKLEVLNLGSNQLYGPIPSSLHQCIELQVLNLDSNKFSGSIPKEIGSLAKLKKVHLGGNILTGNIPREIGNCTLLKEVYLHTNQLTGVMPPEMENLHHLKELDIAFNNITGTISPSLFNLSMLRMVNLAYNQLSGHLSSSSTGLWLPNLEELHLENNQLTGPILDCISNDSRLAILDLSYNSFSGSIPDSIGNLRNLRRLNLAENSLENSSPQLMFLSSLSGCPHLGYLRFNGNPLSGRLPDSVGNLSASLEEFYAYDCEIQGNIPRQIGNLTNLIGLILQQNALTGTIPVEIGRLQYLQDFSLANNSFQGHIPNEMCHLKRLSYLYLLGNQLSGSLPECFNNLTSLKEVYLSSNNFTSIPSAFWQLIDMLQINLSSNSLRGPLPLEIGNLKVLTVLDLSRNQLSAEIPNSIGNLINLAFLSLSNNRFQGPVPQSIGDLVSLEILDLSRNNLSGVIPKSLENLSYLKYFNVSSNRLQGEVPDKGPFVNFSIQSFQNNEALCGPARMELPPCESSTFRQSKNPGVILIRYIIPPVVSILLVLASITIFIRSRRRNIKTTAEDLPSIATWPRISYNELEQATECFSETNLLGTGSFGSVYKGTLPDGMHIAVKVFNLELEGAFQSFDTECEVLRNLRHRNLVKIISSCCNPVFKGLVLEFKPNGSLEKWLYSHNYYLNMVQRLNIMIDVALALEYLHDCSAVTVVHCDVKPSNILLDENMVAYVADFGIAKLLGDGNSVTQTMTLATIGYMAPEYGSEGIVSTKGDVYSFGILLMETLTRKKPTDGVFAGEMSLRQWVKQSLSQSITQVVDANLLRRDEEYYFEAKANCVTSILKLAVQCSADLPEDRIGMKDVVAALKKIKLRFNNDVEQRHLRS